MKNHDTPLISYCRCPHDIISTPQPNSRTDTRYLREGYIIAAVGITYIYKYDSNFPICINKSHELTTFRTTYNIMHT